MEQMTQQFSIPEMAEALEVSRSGFHAHRLKPRRLRRSQDAQLRSLIHQSFEQSRRSYGSPRIQLDLRAAGKRCGKNRINRLMRQDGLRPRQKRRFRPCTTNSRHGHQVAENWLARVPTPDRPGQIWQSDITYLPTGEGWLFLAFTIDTCSRRIVAHHFRDDLSSELATRALERAVAIHRPVTGLIHHSDRGVQYACAAFQQRLQLHHITPSMSRRANPYDNALAESFVATFKAECFGGYVPATRLEAKLLAFDYLESFYNRRRRHSSLGYRSPLEFESLFPPNQPH